MVNAAKEKQDYCRMTGVLHGGAWGLLHKCDIMSTCVPNAGNFNYYEYKKNTILLKLLSLS